MEGIVSMISKATQVSPEINLHDRVITARKTARKTQKEEQGQSALKFDDFRAANKGTGVSCRLSVYLSSLSTEEARTVFKALADRSIQSTAIQRVLTRRGYQGSRESIARSAHRPIITCPHCLPIKEAMNVRPTL